MKKIYSTAEGEWIWDTYTLRWTSPREKQKSFEKPVVAVIAHGKSKEWERWNEYLFQVFKESRLLTGWPTLRELHDDEDKSYFAMLEELHQAEKLKMAA